MNQKAVDQYFMDIALEEAKKGLKEGGIPIGASLAIDGKLVSQGHNQRIQLDNPILHGEMDCLQKAGRLRAKDYQKATIYTTLSPCIMCTGAILLFQIPRVVLAENVNFLGAEDLLRKQGVEVINLNLPEAIHMMQDFIASHAALWNEDIGK